MGYIMLLSDMLYSSIRYNIAFIDYFDFKFFNLNKDQRSEYMGAGSQYEFQLKMNPKKYRRVLSNKIEFLKKFSDVSGRKWATKEMLQTDDQLASILLNNHAGKIVLKNANGQAGRQVEIFDTLNVTKPELVKRMEEKKYTLAEEYVMQHDQLKLLSPSGLNTVRIVTQFYNNEIIILAARLRITVNSQTDNLSTGNIAAHIDLATGRIAGPGIYVDTTKPDVYKHPVTGVELIGFQLPYWEECKALVTKAAMRVSENRSIGWDVAITNDGPVLIEGNHNWHYFIWQAPEKRGYKKSVLKYLS
ncbi:sugar-transfer associated ATP-grasp domain-containing protein [Terrimonas sp.]|uniref:sugar-transfer associated ATP-grasp domain-containing protein n=1 Tax=Terrimonas sp. TaxID=1914338 RepID=UPI001402E715|nr:sugar-transfer associated ATP-grasp domain-containing protein [Terrimonas sp.]